MYRLSDTTLNPEAALQGGEGLIMEDVEIRDARYGQGVLHSSHGPHRLLRCLHKITTSIYKPPDYSGGSQGAKRAEEPQIPQRKGLLAHCTPKEGDNARVICNLQ